MRIIPVIPSRPLLLGLLVAATLAPVRADARQDAKPEPRPAGPRARADGWKAKGTADATEQTGPLQATESTRGAGAVRPIDPPPPVLPERSPADDVTRKETPGSAANESPEGRESTKAPSKEARPVRESATAKKEPAASRMLHSGRGQMSLSEEKAAVDKVTAKTSIAEILAVTLPSRTDNTADWSAGPEALHRCGEPRWIEPCIPLPPCHPSLPPHPLDLVGVAGEPTDGPIYAGPCCPRTGSRDDGPWPHLHRVHDRFFDAFYRTK